MNKNSLSNFFRDTKLVLSKHSPEILTGIGIAGMITTTILAVKATPKALSLIDEKDEVLKPIEVVKTCWKCYIPAAVTGTVSVACLIGASSVNARRYAALTTAYKLSETALVDYKEKVLETFGEKKEKTVREKVHEKQITNNPVSKNEVFITKKGETLCYDTISGRYFKSAMEIIEKAANKLNGRILSDVGGYVTLNDFYDELGLSHIDIGYDLGWNLDNRIDLNLTSHLADDGTPTLVVGHHNAPKYDY